MFAVLILSVTFRCCCCCWKSITIDNRLNATLEEKKFSFVFSSSAVLFVPFILLRFAFWISTHYSNNKTQPNGWGVCMFAAAVVVASWMCSFFFVVVLLLKQSGLHFKRWKIEPFVIFKLACSLSFSLRLRHFRCLLLYHSWTFGCVCVCVSFEADEPVMYACCVPKRKEKKIKDDYGQMGRKTSKRRQSAPIYERVWWKEKANQKVRLNLRTVKHTHITFI